MTIHNGDRVRITAKNSMHTGKEGTVTNAYGDEQSLLVRMDEKGNQVGFFVHEVELVTAANRESDIRKIADVLYASERWMGLPWIQIMETAEDLYDAGMTVRAN